MKKRISYITMFLIIGYPFGSDTDGKKLLQIYEQALTESTQGKSYTHDFTGKKDCNKSRIKYLGQVTTEKGKTFKILTSFYVWGSSCRGTSRIMIYNQGNQYIGNYYLDMPDELPDTLISNSLGYIYNTKACQSRKGTSINFSKGLLKQIFIPCESRKVGNLVSFSP